MIASVRGRISDISATHVVVDVAGIGYLITVPQPTTFVIDTEVLLYTHLAVRENALDLYGFVTRDELSTFELLLKLPKIGPKSALQILTQADIALLHKAVQEQDASYLSKMSGIGKKSAEKIVLGLKDTLTASLPQQGDSHTAAESDAIDALVALGYSQQDARRAIQELPGSHTDTNTKIREALKIIGTP